MPHTQEHNVNSSQRPNPNRLAELSSQRKLALKISCSGVRARDNPYTNDRQAMPRHLEQARATHACVFVKNSGTHASLGCWWKHKRMRPTCLFQEMGIEAACNALKIQTKLSWPAGHTKATRKTCYLTSRPS